MKKLLIILSLLAGALQAQPLDDARAVMWLTNTIKGWHTGHTPKFTVRNGWNPNMMTEPESILANIHPDTKVDIFTLIDQKNLNICRIKGCADARAAEGRVAVNLRWEADPRYNLAGIWLLQGTNSRNYTVSNFVGNVTNVTVSLLATNTINYFALVAEDVGKLRSPLSEEFFYDPSGNEYWRMFGTQEALFPLRTNALGVAYYVIPPAHGANTKPIRLVDFG